MADEATISPTAPAGVAAPGGKGEGKEKVKRVRRYKKKKRCRFCRAEVAEVDFKDLAAVQKLITAQGKMFSRKRSGSCAKHQRSAKRAVKYARFLALLPYISGQ